MYSCVVLFEESDSKVVHVMFTWLISGSSERKAGHQGSQTDSGGECGHPEFLPEYGTGRNSCVSLNHTYLLGFVPGTHFGKFELLTEPGIICSNQEPFSDHVHPD